VSDDLTPEAEEATETPEVQGTPPESSEDLGALKRALEHEREERRQAKEALRRLEEDEDARREWLEKHGYTIDDAAPVVDDDDEYEDDEPDVMTKAEFKAWQDEQAQAQQTKDAVQQFNDDLTRFVGDDRELDQYGDAWIKSQTYKGPEELEQAVNAWFEHLESLGAKPRKKRPTTSPAGGKPVTGVPNYGDMTHEQATEAMVERARALESQT
jgi:hypothetical protein